MSYVSVSPGLGAVPMLASRLPTQTVVRAVPIAPRAVPRPSAPPTVTTEPAPGRVVIPPPAAPATPEDRAFAKAFVAKLTEMAIAKVIDEEPSDLQGFLALTKDQIKSVVEQIERAAKKGSAAARAAFEATAAEVAAAAAAAAEKEAKRKTMMIVGGIAVVGIGAFLFLRKKG